MVRLAVVIATLTFSACSTEENDQRSTPPKPVAQEPQPAQEMQLFDCRPAADKVVEQIGDKVVEQIGDKLDAFLNARCLNNLIDDKDSDSFDINFDSSSGRFDQNEHDLIKERSPADQY